MMSSMVSLTSISVFMALYFTRVCHTAEYDRFAMAEKKDEPVHACGSHLANALYETCEGIFNIENGKRADDKSENTIPDSDYQFTYERYPEVVGAYPLFRSKRSVSSMLRSPAKRRIVDECCKKPCSRNVLRSYCRP